MSGIIKTFKYGDHTVTLETGIVARQASGSVVVRMNDTIVLVTVVGVKGEITEPKGFFPLSVHYQERSYAAGKIPGGYFKREGRASEAETLISRLIDRPLRPLFPEGFENEVQVIATLLSLDPDASPDIPAMIGASAAIAISGIPFNGPIAAARVGYVNGEYVLNPSLAKLANSQLDLVVAGTEKAVLMVESEAKELPESVMLGAVVYGHEHMQSVIRAINELVADVGQKSWNWQPHVRDLELEKNIEALAIEEIEQAYQIPDKQTRYEKLDAIRQKVKQHFCDTAAAVPASERSVSQVLSALEERVVRTRILQGEKRIDGRDTKTVRPINIDVGVLARTHGSALFTRGETQALVVATLGTERDAQTIDAIEGEQKDAFMLHYNFPPYSVGEVGHMTGPKRREIGHGRLAKRGIQAILPEKEAFPYVMRAVSEITESNGSSSMATVCGTSLALMDAGVPVKSHVAGIAMGLIKEGDQFAVLTDILGDEDHLGDMDFKVAGTQAGVTALQMDIKIEGITADIMHQALEQAKEGRLHILGLMNQAISGPRANISPFAPSILKIKVHPDKIRDIIGKGGATIRSITEETGASIDISEDGLVKIAAVDKSAGERALKRIELLTAEAEVGKTYAGTVVKIVEFGAFVNFLPGKDGLLHISQISEERVSNVSEVLQEGQAIRVKVLEIDRQGRIRLSMKEAESFVEAPVSSD